MGLEHFAGYEERREHDIVERPMDFSVSSCVTELFKHSKFLFPLLENGTRTPHREGLRINCV